MSRYDDLDREALIRLLERRDAERPLGLVWERDEIDADRAINDDFVALDLVPALSHGDAPWENLIIEGDNFDALRALRSSHKGAVKCIYIDPPYNTGNRDFVYNDRFVDKTHRFRHSLWLEFMYRRLVLAKELLADDGVIFVSIDDNEMFRLGLLMERVFGEDNRIGTFSWVKKKKGSHLSRNIRSMTEYVVAYARDASRVELFGEQAYSDKWQPLSKKTNAVKGLTFSAGKLETSLPDGSYSSGRRGNGLSALSFEHDFRVEAGVCSAVTVEGRFVWTQAKLDEELQLGTRVKLSAKFGLNALRHDQSEKIKRPSSLISAEAGVGTNEDAFAELAEVLGDERVFTYPKPSSLIKYLVRSCTREDRAGLVLDFFAGSGTTAHAVAKLNAEDGGNRRFILVSNTEATDDAPDKNLCRDVCAERVRRVMGGYTNAKGEAVPGLGGGFAYLRARRVPKHRLSQKLDHPEIWNALQLLHARPLTPWSGDGFAADEGGDAPFAYLANHSPATRTRMAHWIAARGERAAVIYSWAPERYRTADSPHDWRPLPQHLRERFGR